MKNQCVDPRDSIKKSSQSDADTGFELPIDVPPEIDQRDIEDLQTLAKWLESATINLAEIDDIFSDYDQLRSALR